MTAIRSTALAALAAVLVWPAFSRPASADDTDGLVQGIADGIAALKSKTAQADRARAAATPFYQKEIIVEGITIKSSGRVADAALAAAAQTVLKMTRRADILARLVAAKAQVAVIGRTEVTTDIPKYRYLKGKKTADGRDWDADTRGVGGTARNPTTTAAEENILKLLPDRYHDEDLLTHEFAHCIHLIGLKSSERKAVQAAYQAAKNGTAWGAKTYAISDVEEYFAEGSQAFFDVGQTAHPDINNGVATREKLRAADPGLERILTAVYEP